MSGRDIYVVASTDGAGLGSLYVAFETEAEAVAYIATYPPYYDLIVEPVELMQPAVPEEARS